MPTALLPRIRRFAAAASLVCATFASSVAGAATLDFDFIEDTIDTVFSQASFGTSTIDVRFNTAQTLVAPDFVNLTYDAYGGEFRDLPGNSGGRLPATASAALKTIKLYLVDSFVTVSGELSNVLGLGWLGAPGVAVAADRLLGAGYNALTLPIAIAHEIGHNLGLGHLATTADANNLMYPTLPSVTTMARTALTLSQVQTILTSTLLQTDASGSLFLTVQPIYVTAAAVVPPPTPAPVPLPATGLLMIVAIAPIAALRRRRRRATGPARCAA
ncbi:hypothetical protein [Frigidibacter sp. MR17.24]|uniref:hypothetical protein n=1 Tax=Frigidibacter sp. MR17.24 TaxID=3127345 RepID=UPI003012AFBA